MHPDHISILHLRGDGLREGAISFDVGGPGDLIKQHLARVVVEQRPQDQVGKPVIMQIRDGVVQKDRRAVELLLELAIDLFLLIRGQLHARPPKPLELSGLFQPQ